MFWNNGKRYKGYIKIGYFILKIEVNMKVITKKINQNEELCIIIMAIFLEVNGSMINLLL